jgi:hypothetical protein
MDKTLLNQRVMKTRLFIPVLLIGFFSCGTNNKPVTETQKEKITKEVKEVVNAFIKGCEEANPEILIPLYLNSPDFIYAANGKIYNYQESVDTMKLLFSSLLNQKGTIVEEKYTVLDNSSVFYISTSKWIMNFKDGKSVLQDPWTMQYIFKKIDDKWKVIIGNESGVEKNVPGESPKELNQFELVKRILGTWKAEIAKDTFYIAKYKLFGNGIKGAINIVTKGKTIREGEAIIGYDKTTDKLIETDLIEGSDFMVLALWFTSKNVCIEIPYEDISNPEKTTELWQYEFKSPEVFVWNFIKNNKTTLSYNFYREK